MITGTGLGFAYRGGAPVLDAVDLTADGGATDGGTVVGLIGPNGSGKSTLLRLLYGALRPQAGLVMINDVGLAELGPRAVARQIAVVVQEAATDLPYTAAEIVRLGRTPHLGSLQRHSTLDQSAITDAMHRVGVTHLAGRIFSGLSGGEKQRVLIARALAQQASHLLLDEPTNHLDIRYQHEILHLVRELGVTTIVVLHDLNLAGRYCDRLLLLDRGRVVADGTPGEVLVPDLIEPVYGIGVQRIDQAGTPQLIFTRSGVDIAAGTSDHE